MHLSIHTLNSICLVKYFIPLFSAAFYLSNCKDHLRKNMKVILVISCNILWVLKWHKDVLFPKLTKLGISAMKCENLKLWKRGSGKSRVLWSIFNRLQDLLLILLLLMFCFIFSNFRMLVQSQEYQAYICCIISSVPHMDWKIRTKNKNNKNIIT